MDDSELSGDDSEELELVDYAKLIDDLAADGADPAFLDFLSNAIKFIHLDCGGADVDLGFCSRLYLAVHGTLITCGWSVSVEARPENQGFSFVCYRVLDHDEVEQAREDGVLPETPEGKVAVMRTDPIVGSITKPWAIAKAACQTLVDLIVDGHLKPAKNPRLGDEDDDLDCHLDDINKYGSDEPEGRV